MKHLTINFLCIQEEEEETDEELEELGQMLYVGPVAGEWTSLGSELEIVEEVPFDQQEIVRRFFFMVANVI